MQTDPALQCNDGYDIGTNDSLLASVTGFVLKSSSVIVHIDDLVPFKSESYTHSHNRKDTRQNKAH